MSMDGAAGTLFSEGNEAFVDEDFEMAIDKYSQAIALSPENVAGCYLKRAAAHGKCEQHEKALEDIEKCLSYDGGNEKALLKKSVTLFSLGDFEKALPIFKSLSPREQINTWIRKCEAELDLKENNDSSEISVGFSHDVVDITDIGMDCTETSAMNTTPAIDSDTKTVEPTCEAVSVAQAPAAKMKYDWYQTDAYVIISVLVKRVKQEDVEVHYAEKMLSLTVKLPSGSDYSLELDLAHAIVPEACTTKVLSTKLELNMKKAAGIRWSSLETDNESQFSNVGKPATEINTSKVKAADQPSTSDVHKYPSSARAYHDWDSLAREVTEDEKKEEETGDAALNSLFKKIYSDGSDEVKKAMNKSFQESGGTVLSTNWGEIGQQKTDIKPPDSMEYKKYEY